MARRELLILSCVLALYALPLQESGAAAAIRVGTYTDPPLVFQDAKGAPQGIYIDILEHVTKKEGWTLQYVYGSWEECLERLGRGNIDLVVAIGYSPERSRQFDFTAESVLVNWGQVYVRDTSPIKTMLDLTGRKLAVVRRDIYYETFKSIHDILKIYPEFIEVDAYPDALRLLAEGKTDAALVSRLFGSYYQKDLPIEKSPIMFHPTELRFAVPKGRNKQLADALDRHLALLKADKRSAYYSSLNVWVEGVQTLVLPKWLRPIWVLSFVASVLLLIMGMNLILRWQVRVKTAALKDSLAAQEKVASELRIAREIQMSSMPKRYPCIPGYEIYGVLQPARAVGGDFYDCFLIDQDHLCFVLGDVSDKGVPAALFMAATKTLINSSALATSHPNRILELVNRRTCLDNDASMFVTVFCGILDTRTGNVSYTNAGHNPPAVVRDGTGVDFLEAGRSPALGIDEDSRYEESLLTLNPGDILFVYTDGVTEAMNARGEMFSDERLQHELSISRKGSAKDLATQMLQRVREFSGDAPQADDIALLTLVRFQDKRAES